MAGVIGTVTNRSAFSSFIVRNWEAWMTEAVILHASGVSVPELRVRFGKTDQHIRNIMNTDQAKEIVLKISRQAISHASTTLNEKLTQAKLLAVGNIVDALGDEDLRAAKPFDFWDHSRKSLETIQKMDAPPPMPTSVTNNILNVSPEILERLRSTPTMAEVLTTQHHVDYIGPPPPTGRNEEKLLGRGVSPVANQGEDGPSVPLSGRPVP